MAFAGFEMQTALWLTAAVASGISFNEYRKLPDATRWKDLRDKVRDLESELSARAADVDSARQVIASGKEAKAEKDECERRLAKVRDDLLSLDAERKQQEELRRELSATQEKCAQAQAAVERLSTESARLAVEVRGLGQRRDEAKAEIQSAEERGKRLVETAEALEDKLRQGRAACADTESQLAKSRSALADANRELDERVRRVAELRKQQEDLGHAVARLLREQAVAEQEHARAKQQLEEVRRRAAEDEKRAQELKRRADEAEVVAAAAQARAKRAEADAADAAARREQAAKALADTQRQAAEEGARLAGMRAERDGLQATIASLKAIAESLRKDLDKQGASPTGDRFQDLWTPLPFSPLRAIDRTRKEEEALQSTASYIAAQGLSFPPRVLHAFHTALKVNAISPLVVLAGIAGTGKSELPRRYAEGMGMHFSLLAVQPRWDSPQDLFGFYNYLEHRYKATELARALVQFDRYNRGSWPLPKGWSHGREDRVLLVLLDEMNLARVEYYFSEFLSKLETRRGVRREDPNERAKAEIALETGSIREQEQPLRIFADNNVLFTGTMNEDESTQTLSDKVLDRACVLRFGRPRTTRPASSQGERPAPAERGLTYDCWRSWQQDGAASRSELAQVDDSVGVLNDAMESLGRPFGHRVAQAIQAYVANYPRWVPGRLGMAFADQIEQRILPKLRGADVEEHRASFETIKSVIATCEDPQLQEAFHRGYEGQSTFIWRGLDRSER